MRESCFLDPRAETFYGDWQRYAGDIVRDRRYAFYARTRQWDKLAALEAQFVAAGASPCAIATRLRALADRLHPAVAARPVPHVEREAVA